MSKENKRKNAGGTTNKMGQYKLGYKVKCDKCGNEWTPVVKELSFNPKTMLIVSGFVCKKCKAEYVVTVTDNELRKAMSYVKQLELEIKAYRKHIQHEQAEWAKNGKPMPKDIKQRLDKHLFDLEADYHNLIKSNQDRGAVLKKEYLANK